MYLLTFHCLATTLATLITQCTVQITCKVANSRVWRWIYPRVTSNLHACDEAGAHGKLACVATRGCWCNSKVIHCTTKYWGINTATGKYVHARQFFSVAMPFHSSCLDPPAVLFRSSICSSRRSLDVFTLLTCCFHC